MFKKILLATVILMFIGALVFGAVNRTLAKNSQESSRHTRKSGSSEYSSFTPQPGSTNSLGQGWGQVNGGNGRRSGVGTNRGGSGEQYNLPPATPGELSDAESAALSFMREEEKMAHDVYVALYENWGLRIFQNISQSEQTHADAVKILLDRYGLPDPASSSIGVFTDPTLQTLYNKLVAQGSQSLVEALKVGAAIEEIDIMDLEKHLAQTDNADIQQVFNNLLNGSTNHLRAFVSNLSAKTDETYAPQYLSVASYQSILGSNTDIRRNGSGGSGGGGGGYRGGRP